MTKTHYRACKCPVGVVVCTDFDAFLIELKESQLSLKRQLRDNEPSFMIIEALIYQVDVMIKEISELENDLAEATNGMKTVEEQIVQTKSVIEEMTGLWNKEMRRLWDVKGIEQ